MPSPIAHSLAGVATARLLLPRGVEKPLRWYAVAVVAANAADFDIAAGILAGSINSMHGAATHSVFAALVAAAVCMVPASRSIGGRRRVGVLVAVSYATHLVLDLLTGPVQRPGLPLLWPFSDAEWMAPWLPFDGILHGGPGAGVGRFTEELLSVANLRSMGFELLTLLPFVAVSWLATRRREARD